jgi:hypothetical protein
MRLIGSVLRLTDDGAVLLTERQQRYFVPLRELRGMRLERGHVVSFRPAQGAHGAAIALDVRRHRPLLSIHDGARTAIGGART